MGGAGWVPVAGLGTLGWKDDKASGTVAVCLDGTGWKKGRGSCLRITDRVRVSPTSQPAALCCDDGWDVEHVRLCPGTVVGSAFCCTVSLPPRCPLDSRRTGNTTTLRKRPVTVLLL